MDDRIRSNGKYNFRKNMPLYLMLLPFMLIFFTFTILPVLMATFTSFTHYDIIQPPRFVGLENFRRLFLEDELFILSIQNTFVLSVIIGPAGYLLAFFMAWLINELPRKLRAVLTIIFYAPSMSAAAFTGFFLFFFSPDPFGWLNSILLSNGLREEPVLWLSDPTYMKPIVIITQLLMALGVGFLSFVAGLQTVDKTQYEAAYVDGIRNRWQELWFITLPNMTPQLRFGAVMAITGVLALDPSGLMGFPSAQYETHTIVNHLFDFGSVRMEMGYASAIALVLLGIMLGCNKLFQMFLRRVGT
jgi:multiple sugar transport system permease protein